MTPKLSVIIPVYNTEKYIQKCVNSVISQTFKDYEIILVDDGSTDSSGKICDEYAAKYEFISVVHKENCGLLHTRKTGFQISKGLYISYLDSDDYIDPDMYEYMMSKVERYNADMVICDMLRETNRKKFFIRNNLEPGFYDKEMLEKKVYENLLVGGKKGRPGIISSLCNKIIKREIIENVLKDADDRVDFGEDTLCSVPGLLDSESIYLCDKAFYHYRTVESSITNTYDKGRMQEFILLINLLDKAFEKRSFDGREQLNQYAAKFSIDCIRSELLFGAESSVKKRIGIVRQYLEDPRIAEAFETVSTNDFGVVDDLKTKFIKKKMFFALYLSFYIRNMILRIWGE